MSAAGLIALAAASVALLVALVTWRKWNAFLALFVAALSVGLGAGLPPTGALRVFADGMGATLGGIASVIALGAMLGHFLAESGGAWVLAARLRSLFGEERVVWCVVALACLVGLVTWFAVGLLLLLPVVVSLTRESRRPFLLLALPLVSFLSVMHGFTPPHPGPVVAIDTLGALTGKVLLLAFAIGLPVATIAGPIFARWIAPRLSVPAPGDLSVPVPVAPAPSVGATLLVIALPICLMLLATAAELAWANGNPLREWVAFVGHPVVALALAVLVAGVVLRRPAGFSRGAWQSCGERGVAEIGTTLLVVGAGGGFARVLREAGVASALGEVASGLQLPPLIYGWLLAAFIRVATGSSTVATTAAAGLLVPYLEAFPGTDRELLVIAIGSGSLFLSHLNDGGFWIVKECLGLTVGQTLRTWTVLETLIGLLGLAGVLLLAPLFSP